MEKWDITPLDLSGLKFEHHEQVIYFLRVRLAEQRDYIAKLTERQYLLPVDVYQERREAALFQKARIFMTLDKYFDLWTGINPIP